MRPYIILHMLTSIDGKITGEYLSSPVGETLCEEYYRINREYKADAYLCGRITMEGSFTGGKSPDLTAFEGTKADWSDFVAKTHPYYAVAIDPHGRLGWEDSEIHDYDPGYDDAHIIEVVTEMASDAYLNYLKSKNISYIVCGKDKVDAKLACEKLTSLFGIKKLMLEGGGLTDTLFFDEGLVDELSIVFVPIVDGSKGVDLFANKNCPLTVFSLKDCQRLDKNGLWLNYVKE